MVIMSECGLFVVEALLATIQDMGRLGYRAKGIPPSGALDRISAAYANVLVGNPPIYPVIEAVGGHLRVRFTCDAIISLTGGNSEVFINGRKGSMWEPLLINRGSEVVVKGVLKGLTVYLGVSGGLYLKPILGSHSTYVRGGFGGIGRYLSKGDFLPLRKGDVSGKFELLEGLKPPQYIPLRVEGISSPRIIRVTEGIHAHLYKEDYRLLLDSTYTITSRSDRMGFRLEGPILRRVAASGGIPSVATDRGYVQVPPNGKPIVLMSDAQTTGGYVVMAHVLPPDTDLLAQTPPGARISFREVKFDEAEEIVRNYLDFLKNPPVEPVVHPSLGEVPPDDVLNFIIRQAKIEEN